MSSIAVTPSTPAPTLLGHLWPTRHRINDLVRALIAVALGSVLLTLSAKTQVPFAPVPMTMQTLVVLMIGAAYGWRLGGATVLLYLAQGASGLPVFAGPMAGPAYLAGPTAGFLAGFLAAACLVGYLAERGWGQSLFRLVLLMVAGHAVIFAFGLGWLALLIGPGKAWMMGAQPFLLATVLKTALAAGLIQAGWSLARRER